MTRWARTVAGVAALAVLSGCGGADGGGVPRGEASQRAEEIRTEAAVLFPKLAASMSAVSFTGSGTARWKICGMPPHPSGAEYVAEVTVDQADTGVSGRLAAVEELLDGQGWTLVEDTSGTVTSSKQGTTLTARVAGGGASLALSSGCLDLSGDLIDELTDPGRRDDLGLTPPS